MMTSDEFDRKCRLYEQKVNHVLAQGDKLDEECRCYAIQSRYLKSDRHSFTLLANWKCNELELMAWDWDAEECVNGEDDLDALELLADYGVENWKDLPITAEGCSFCPFRYSCHSVRMAVEKYERELSNE